jgi:hypothetical protein
MPTLTEQIRELAGKDRIAFKKHTLLRMRQRSITADDVKAALVACELAETYPDDYPLPSCLVLGRTPDGRPIHIVVATDTEATMLWLITVYEPTLEHWEPDFRTRRKKDEMSPM